MICTADSMCLSLFVFMQLFSEVAPNVNDVPGSLSVYASNKCSYNGTSVTYTPRWDKANVDLYYYTSMKLLSDIRIPWYLLSDDSFNNKHDVLYFIDSFYTDIVAALQTSSDSTDFYK